MNAMISDIKKSVEFIFSRCDGAHSRDAQGWNGFDRKIMDDLREQDWSPAQANLVWKILQKYSRQLAEIDIDPKSLPKNELPQEKVSSPTHGTWGNRIYLMESGQIALQTRYDPDLVSQIRELPERAWNPTNKNWVIDPQKNPLALPSLLEFCRKNNIAVEPEIYTLREASEKALKVLESKIVSSVSDSLAHDADIEIENLGGTLLGYQKAGVNYAHSRRRVLIADEMGLGKTIQALATLQKIGDSAFPALVVCPASLRRNWVRESKKWLLNRTSDLYENQVLGINPDIQVVSYEVFSKLYQIPEDGNDSEILPDVSRFRSVVFDESHYLKNYKSLRGKAAKNFCKILKKASGNILMLTGTPILNRPSELLNLLSILGRLEDVGGFKKFRDRYIYRSGNLAELQQLCRANFMIRREKSQVLKELPPKRRINVEIEMKNPAQYRTVEDAPMEDDNEAAALVRLGELRREAARQKIDGICQWVEEFLETDKKLVLFSVHREIQKILCEKFPDALTIFGDDDQWKRQNSVDQFQNDPDKKLILCSLKAAGVGLTLTAASDVAFCELGWTPADMDQAEDRCHRIGQQDSVTAYYFLASATIDGSMKNLIEEKRELGKALLDPSKINLENKESAKYQLIKSILANSKGKK